MSPDGTFMGVLDALQAGARATVPRLVHHHDEETKNRSPAKRVYLDLFGGEPDNVDRDTREPIDNSARIALKTDNPQFSHFRLFEREPNATKLRRALAEEFPGEDLIVYPGDCNDTIHQALADLRAVDAGWAPTFAFIDPDGPHYTWQTLQALAAHKGPSAKTKVELWMLFPAPLFARMLPGTGEVRPSDNAAITAMFGVPRWHAIWNAELDAEIEAAEARGEYVNLMRWRLERELGYRWTHQLEIRNTGGVPLYHLIFATDSEAGHLIISTTSTTRRPPSFRRWPSRHVHCASDADAKRTVSTTSSPLSIPTTYRWRCHPRAPRVSGSTCTSRQTNLEPTTPVAAPTVTDDVRGMGSSNAAPVALHLSAVVWPSVPSRRHSHDLPW